MPLKRSEFIQNSNLMIYITICALYLLFTYFQKIFIYSDILYYNSFVDKLSAETIEKIINQKNKYEWIGYLLQPLLLFIKFSLTTLCIYIYFLFANTNNSISYKDILRCVLVSELIFVFVALFKILYFGIFHVPDSIEEIQLFQPLSLYQLLGNKDTKMYLFYPMATINLFEFIYWLLISYFISVTSNLSFKKSFYTLIKSYGIGLALWLAIVTFIQLQFA
jgi:hypothetical protein